MFLLRLHECFEPLPPLLALLAVVAVAALVGLQAGGRELVDALHGGVEEVTVVGDHQQRPGEGRHPLLQPRPAVAIEVVGGLVEQQDRRVGEHDRAEQAARRLPARERAQSRPTIEVLDPQAPQRLVQARLQRPAAERLEALLRAAVGVAGRSGRPRAHRVRASPPRPLRALVVGDRRSSSADRGRPAADSRRDRPRRAPPRRVVDARRRPAGAGASSCRRRWRRPGRRARRRRA